MATKITAQRYLRYRRASSLQLTLQITRLKRRISADFLHSEVSDSCSDHKRSLPKRNYGILHFTKPQAPCAQMRSVLLTVRNSLNKEMKLS